MPTLLSLAAMKAFSLGRRAKWKDYVDLYFLLRDSLVLPFYTMRNPFSLKICTMRNPARGSARGFLQGS
jgi:hypothetical protein